MSEIPAYYITSFAKSRLIITFGVSPKDDNIEPVKLDEMLEDYGLSRVYEETWYTEPEEDDEDTFVTREMHFECPADELRIPDPPGMLKALTEPFIGRPWTGCDALKTELTELLSPGVLLSFAVVTVHAEWEVEWRRRTTRMPILHTTNRPR